MFQVIPFATPSIIFGMDTINQIGQQAKKLGAGRVLLVTGPNVKEAGILDKTLSFLKAESLEVEVNIQGRDTPEPATSVVEDTAEVARKGKFDVIIGVGGGSILDVSKMASALLTNPGKTRDYFGREKVPQRGRPTIIVPTTSGTGAEVTKHAIFLDREVNVKKAVASTNLLPNVAIVDPMLTVSCPPHVTAAAGIDAFFHAVEPFLSQMANPITDALALDSISIITKWLGPAFADGQNLRPLPNGPGQPDVRDRAQQLRHEPGPRDGVPGGRRISHLPRGDPERHSAGLFRRNPDGQGREDGSAGRSHGRAGSGPGAAGGGPQGFGRIRHLLKSVDLPVSLGEFDITDDPDIPSGPWKPTRSNGSCPGPRASCS